MVALARVQKLRTEIVILCLQIIEKLSVQLHFQLTVSRLALEIQHMIPADAKTLALE